MTRTNAKMTKCRATQLLFGIRNHVFSASELKKAYHTKARKLHPDKNKSQNATLEFQTIKDAYELLAASMSTQGHTYQYTNYTAVRQREAQQRQEELQRELARQRIERERLIAQQAQKLAEERIKMEHKMRNELAARAAQVCRENEMRRRKEEDQKRRELEERKRREIEAEKQRKAQEQKQREAEERKKREVVEQQERERQSLTQAAISARKDIAKQLLDNVKKQWLSRNTREYTVNDSQYVTHSEKQTKEDYERQLVQQQEALAQLRTSHLDATQRGCDGLASMMKRTIMKQPNKPKQCETITQAGPKQIHGTQDASGQLPLYCFMSRLPQEQSSPPSVPEVETKQARQGHDTPPVRTFNRRRIKPKRICQHKECTSIARSGSQFCRAHGGGKTCSHPSCKNMVQSKGLCSIHGGRPRCAAPRCKKVAKSPSRYCVMCSGGRQQCVTIGCTMRQHQKGGYCDACFLKLNDGKVIQKSGSCHILDQIDVESQGATGLCHLFPQFMRTRQDLDFVRNVKGRRFDELISDKLMTRVCITSLKLLSCVCKNLRVAVQRVNVHPFHCGDVVEMSAHGRLTHLDNCLDEDIRIQKHLDHLFMVVTGVDSKTMRIQVQTMGWKKCLTGDGKEVVVPVLNSKKGQKRKMQEAGIDGIAATTTDVSVLVRLPKTSRHKTIDECRRDHDHYVKFECPNKRYKLAHKDTHIDFADGVALCMNSLKKAWQR